MRESLFILPPVGSLQHLPQHLYPVIADDVCITIYLFWRIPSNPYKPGVRRRWQNTSYDGWQGITSSGSSRRKARRRSEPDRVGVTVAAAQARTKLRSWRTLDYDTGIGLSSGPKLILLSPKTILSSQDKTNPPPPAKASQCVRGRACMVHCMNRRPRYLSTLP